MNKYEEYNKIKKMEQLIKNNLSYYFLDDITINIDEDNYLIITERKEINIHFILGYILDMWPSINIDNFNVEVCEDLRSMLISFD